MATTSTLTSAVKATTFTPRPIFDVSQNITRSYFLGHHNAALDRMRRTLSNIGLVIECRDMRVPLSSWNPLLESTLATSSSSDTGAALAFSKRQSGSGGSGYGNRARIIVYTHADLVPPREGSRIAKMLREFHESQGHAAATVFLGSDNDAHANSKKDRARLMEAIKAVARRHDSLTGLRALVVGMPNAGKSTLLNRLRSTGMGGGVAKAARTGAQPGVTRRLGTPVRILAEEEGDEAGYGGSMGRGVFVVDTPGVFVPYVPDAESMLRLALVGCVRDGLVPAVTVADYLLYHLNLSEASFEAYKEYSPATNEIEEFLTGVAMRTGKLVKGGVPSMEGAADWIVQAFRRGDLGRYVLDEVNRETLGDAQRSAKNPPLSFNQARKKEKELRKTRMATRMRGEAQA